MSNYGVGANFRTIADNHATNNLRAGAQKNSLADLRCSIGVLVEVNTQSHLLKNLNTIGNPGIRANDDAVEMRQIDTPPQKSRRRQLATSARKHKLLSNLAKHAHWSKTRILRTAQEQKEPEMSTARLSAICVKVAFKNMRETRFMVIIHMSNLSSNWSLAPLHHLSNSNANEVCRENN